MKNRLQRLIALGIVTVLAVSTVAFTSRDSISGVVTIAAETDPESETETETESEADPTASGSTEDPEGSGADEPAGESADEETAPEETVPDGETASDEEAAPDQIVSDEEASPEEAVSDEESGEEDAGVVSSDWESLTADVGAVGDELVLDVDNDGTDPDAGEPLVADPAQEAGDAGEQPAETAAEETEAAEEAETEEEAEEEAAANIIGFSVDPSLYPAADASANTRYIYNYLTKTMGFNHAAACGILANMQMESAFNPLALGDGGTSYGLCQWHNERFNSLISYCNSVGLDYNTLDGQLANLNRELTGAYSSIYSYIMSVPDTAQGAYDAGYYWCVYFEIPNNAASHGALRGNLASNEYYPLDLSMDDSEEMPIEDSIFRLREDMALQSEGWAVNTEEDGSVIFSFPEVVLVKKAE